MRTKADELRGRLARLEKLAGKEACPFCRLSRRHSGLDPTKPRHKPKDAALVVTSFCEMCGASSVNDLSGYPEEGREIARLYHAAKLEDLFTDPHAWAAQMWVTNRMMAYQQHLIAAREMRKLSAAQSQTLGEMQRRDYARPQTARERERTRAKDPDFRRYQELLAESQIFFKRRRQRLEHQHGERPFPELETRINAVQSPDYYELCKGEPFKHDVPFRPMYEIGQEAGYWTKCAEMEKFLLGDVTAHTAGMLADCDRRAREVIEVGRAKHEAREEKQRREKAERESARLERLASSAPTPIGAQETLGGSSIPANLGRTQPPSAVKRGANSADPSQPSGQDFVTPIDGYDDVIDPSF